MNKFTKQWIILDNAVNTFPIIPDDYAGFSSFYKYHLVVPSHFYYALDLLMQENSRLRRKLHESKQRAKSWHMKYISIMIKNAELSYLLIDKEVETKGTHWFRKICEDKPMMAKQIICSNSTCRKCILHETSCLIPQFVKEDLCSKYLKDNRKC